MGPLCSRWPLVVFGLSILAACSKRPATPASHASEALAGVDCTTLKLPMEPDLLAWDASSRAQLDKLRRQGVVAVRYEARGCEVSLELLPQCVGPKNRYVYSAFSDKGAKLAHDPRELVTLLPVGAANVADLVRGDQVLRADSQIVGAVGLPKGSTITEYDFVGPDCKQATHAIATVYVGGFAMAATDAGHASGPNLFTTTATIAGLTREGIAPVCDRSEAEGIELLGCSVPLRLALIPLGDGTTPAPARGPRPAASVPEPTTSCVPHGDGGCAGEPRVFDQNAVERVVREKQASVKRKCWDTAADTVRRVTVSVRTTIDPQGRVIQAGAQLVDSDGSLDVAATVARCIANEVRTWQFPDPEKQKVITLPFHLIRQQ